MKEKIEKLTEKLKQLKTKIFKGRKEKEDTAAEAAESINGVEIIESAGDGELELKPKMKKWKKILLIIGGVIASLAVILIIVYVSLVNSGKKSLYANATSEKPSFRTTEKETDESGEYIQEFDMSVDDDGNIVIFEGTNENEDEDGTSGSTNGGSGSNGGSSNGGSSDSSTDSDSSESGLKRHTVSFEGVTDDSDYDIIFDGVKYAYNSDIITLLFLGIDKLTEVSPAEDGISGGQADSLFLLVLNPHTKVYDILAIHRNSIALVDVYDADNNYVGTGYTQICLQHAYGGGMEKSNEMTMNSVSRLLYDLPIHSVTSINMGAIPKLNDSIGGVTLTSLETFEYGGYSFTEGEEVTLMGQAAYEYIHYRNLYISNSAGMRLNRQKQYLTAFMSVGMSQIKSDVSKVLDVYDIISKYVVTDLSVDRITYLASEIINYSFGGIYTFEGALDTDTKWKYERYNLDMDSVYELLIQEFYEKVE